MVCRAYTASEDDTIREDITGSSRAFEWLMFSFQLERGVLHWQKVDRESSLWTVIFIMMENKRAHQNCNSIKNLHLD